jgi:hypothetical protein
MPMSASAMTREDGHPFVTEAAVLDVFVSRAASFGAELDRTRLVAFLTRAGIFLNEIRRSDRSTLSRYRIERAGGFAFFTPTVPPLDDVPRGFEASTSKEVAPATGAA